MTHLCRVRVRERIEDRIEHEDAERGRELHCIALRGRVRELEEDLAERAEERRCERERDANDPETVARHRASCKCECKWVAADEGYVCMCMCGTRELAAVRTTAGVHDSSKRQLCSWRDDDRDGRCRCRSAAFVLNGQYLFKTIISNNDRVSIFSVVLAVPLNREHTNL